MQLATGLEKINLCDLYPELYVIFPVNNPLEGNLLSQKRYLSHAVPA